jgi:hypothetical protein
MPRRSETQGAPFRIDAHREECLSTHALSSPCHLTREVDCPDSIRHVTWRQIKAEIHGEKERKRK